MTGTGSWSWPRFRPATGSRFRIRPAGCSAPCTPPNWPAWILPRSSARPSPNGTWPEPGTSPASWTPGSARGFYPLSPQPQGGWAGRVCRLPDPGRQAYLAEIAAMMDDRTSRLGQHIAQTSPAWAVNALGPVPASQTARRA